MLLQENHFYSVFYSVLTILNAIKMNVKMFKKGLLCLLVANTTGPFLNIFEGYANIICFYNKFISIVSSIVNAIWMNVINVQERPCCVCLFACLLVANTTGLS